MEYKVNDQGLNASVFIPFVNKVWPGDYDEEKTQTALSKTLNISAYENNVLVGCLRILSDGYFFGTITELLVLPNIRNVVSAASVLQLAKDNTPTMLYFGAQPGVEPFYERNGCQRSLQSYTIRGIKMTNYTFEEIKGLLLKSIQEHDFESELRLCFHDNPNEYMIIIYDDHCSFQRCGNPKEASGKYNYESLDELYKAQQLMGLFWKGTGEN